MHCAVNCIRTYAHTHTLIYPSFSSSSSPPRPPPSPSCSTFVYCYFRLTCLRCICTWPFGCSCSTQYEIFNIIQTNVISCNHHHHHFYQFHYYFHYYFLPQSLLPINNKRLRLKTNAVSDFCVRKYEQHYIYKSTGQCTNLEAKFLRHHPLLQKTNGLGDYYSQDYMDIQKISCNFINVRRQSHADMN